MHSFPCPLSLLTVTVTVKKLSWELWIETEPLSLLCTLSHIVFNLAQVDRHGSVVPYLIYEKKVQPYWMALVRYPHVRNGGEVLKLIVVFQTKETPITLLFETVGPLNEDDTKMSYETFKTGITDRNDARYMDIERLMHTTYPQETINEIWPKSMDTLSLGHPLSTLYPVNVARFTCGLTQCSNLHPVEAYDILEDDVLEQCKTQ